MSEESTPLPLHPSIRERFPGPAFLYESLCEAAKSPGSGVGFAGVHPVCGVRRCERDTDDTTASGGGGRTAGSRGEVPRGKTLFGVVGRSFDRARDV